jgi:hypothetical protein
LSGFQPILLLLQQNKKCEVVPMLAYLPHLTVEVRPSGKSGCVSGNTMGHFQVVI